ncbi:MAG: hypothetical protein E6729_03825 [Finegoldia magna]|nr:hypothetical protein [Finegoldia magna]
MKRTKWKSVNSGVVITSLDYRTLREKEVLKSYEEYLDNFDWDYAKVLEEAPQTIIEFSEKFMECDRDFYPVGINGNRLDPEIDEIDYRAFDLFSRKKYIRCVNKFNQILISHGYKTQQL